jgi:hypothetical protein
MVRILQSYDAVNTNHRDAVNGTYEIQYRRVKDFFEQRTENWVIQEERGEFTGVKHREGARRGGVRG